MEKLWDCFTEELNDNVILSLPKTLFKLIAQSMNKLEKKLE
jgi:hypothetical protein